MDLKQRRAEHTHGQVKTANSTSTQAPDRLTIASAVYQTVSQQSAKVALAKFPQDISVAQRRGLFQMQYNTSR